MNTLGYIAYVMGLYSCVCAYSPNEYVRSMHNLPHLDKNLNTVNSDFAITAKSTQNEYSTSLVIFPVIIGVIAMIVILGFVVGMMFRFCCNCCKCGPNTNPTNSDLKKKRNLTIACVIFAIIVVAFNFTILSGNAHLTDGVNKGIDSINFVSDTAYRLQDNGNTMVDEAQSIRDNLVLATATGCPFADNIYPYMDDFENAATSFVDEIGDIPQKTDNAATAMRTYGIEKKNSVIWVFFAVHLVLVGLFVAGYVCQSPCAERMAITVSTLVAITLVVLCTLVMIILMGWADFCMDPNKSSLYVIQADAGSSVANTAAYYIECTGVNPLANDIAEAKKAINDIEAQVRYLTDPGGLCEYNQAMLDILDSVVVVNDAILDIATVLDCEPVQKEWNSGVQEGTCSDMYAGFFEIWRALYFCTFFMIVLSITASMLYQYFHIQVENEENVENRDSKDMEMVGGAGSDKGIYGGRGSDDRFSNKRHSDSSYEQAPSSEASAPPESFMVV